MPDKRGNPTETEIRNSIKQYLQWNGWFTITLYQSALSYKGIADLYAIKDGVNVWLEVKKPTGKQSEHQKRFQADIESKQGFYFVVKSIDDVTRVMKGLGV